ncbi:MAG: hypothetical protein HMLKMBBP_02297 [Planctomycetes bacterium]|nr:hypothetical protein [Planctomycetota bacterium]
MGSDGGPESRRGADKPGRSFHVLAAVVLVVCVLVGFRHFWFGGQAYPGREIAPPIRGLVIAHGVAMALWMALLLAQTYLVVSFRVRIHRMLGTAGAVLALAIVGLGWKVGIESARNAPPEFQLHGLGARAFMAISVLGVTMFGIFVGVGVAMRKRPAPHRAAMTLGTLAAVTAALDRIDEITQPLLDTPLHAAFGPFSAAVLIGAMLVGIRWAMAGALDRAWAVGFGALCAGFAAVWFVASTAAWDSFARALLGA